MKISRFFFWINIHTKALRWKLLGKKRSDGNTRALNFYPFLGRLPSGYENVVGLQRINVSDIFTLELANTVDLGWVMLNEVDHTSKKTFFHTVKSDFCRWLDGPHAPRCLQKSLFLHAGGAPVHKNKKPEKNRNPSSPIVAATWIWSSQGWQRH